MLKSSARSAIRLRGVRQNNLKNFDLDLPLNQLIVVTGLSGSGKSSLAFDTLFAEGQRRYIETFSPYARQFFDRMDKPQVDSIEGIPPSIAIEQRNAVKTTRSTVGTMTEICDHMKLLWPHLAQLHCRQCGQPVRKDSPQSIWSFLRAEEASRPTEILITFELPLTEKLSLDESLALISKQGYQRLFFKGQIIRLDEIQSRIPDKRSRINSLMVIQDRLKLADAARSRFIEACEQAYHFGKGKLSIHTLADKANHHPSSTTHKPFSNRLHCATCDLEYREPSAALFSFNNPVGACPTCRGFGRVISIDYNLALPDRSKTLSQGVVRPWQTGQGIDCQRDLLRMCRHFEVPTDVPFEKLPKKWQDLVIDGEPDYGKDEEHEWPRAWYGIKGYFRWLESKAYKMHVRVLLSRYRAYTPCPDCKGKRFQPEALLYRVLIPDPANGQAANPLTLADFYQLPIRDALKAVEAIAGKRSRTAKDPLALVLHEVRSRLGYLNEVGLGYLTLDRATRSLSGGETERVNLTTCLGTRLVNTLFVLDEPSVGLHPRDTERLVRVLQQLRDAGNTVVVVEHEASVMRAANQIVDLGPGHGATGGQVVFQGTYNEILESESSLTGQYLSGRKRIELSERRSTQFQARAAYVYSERGRASNSLILNDAPMSFGARPATQAPLKLSHAALHNLDDLSVEIPLGRFVCVTGVSGSGKTTLVREVLLPALASRLKSGGQNMKASDRLSSEENGNDEENAAESPPDAVLLEGWETLGRVVLVDQSILGKTPRSNPAVYIGAFDDIREFFAQSELAKQRGLNASAFSFNSSQGQCERCRGAGFEKIEMQFLSDIFIRCPDCNGRRYRPHILQIKISPSPKPSRTSRLAARASRSFSIADLLDATIEEAIEFLGAFPDSRPAQRAVQSLKLLEEVGLGYLKLGQPINTLSGGESQRLKLVRHLAEAVTAPPIHSTGRYVQSTDESKPTLFLFDEPTTGLHFDDVRVLLRVFQRLVDAGHSVLVIEHNLDVIKSADWVIDLGPDAGDQGGRLVAEGTPEQVAANPRSHTGGALRETLNLKFRAAAQRQTVVSSKRA
jgi:excinuclease ABC subunit A